MLVETFGGFGPGLMAVLRQADDWRQGRLVSSEYDETTWAARNYMAFAAQRISVAVHIAAAQEIAEALGLSVAADPRALYGAELVFDIYREDRPVGQHRARFRAIDGGVA